MHIGRAVYKAEKTISLNEVVETMETEMFQIGKCSVSTTTAMNPLENYKRQSVDNTNAFHIPGGNVFDVSLNVWMDGWTVLLCMYIWFTFTQRSLEMEKKENDEKGEREKAKMILTSEAHSVYRNILECSVVYLYTF